MKAAVTKDFGIVQVEDVPEPEPDSDQIKVRIAYCGICGTELHMFDPEYRKGLFQSTQPSSLGPEIAGHEASGTIVAIGSAIKAYHVGQRVACNFHSSCGSCYYCRNKMEHFCERAFFASGAYAEYAIYKEDLIYALPDTVSLEQGAFLEPVSVAIHVVDLANIRPGSSLAILGSGPIGLLIQQVALRAGAVKILVGEPSAERRQIAKELGASVVVDTHNENLLEMSNKLTDGRGFDTVIDASGKLTAAKQAITMADKGGTIVWVGGYPIGNEISVTPSYIYSKELTIRTALSAPYCFERALKLLPQLKLKPLISIMPLEKINNAFQLLANGQGIKILIKP